MNVTVFYGIMLPFFGTMLGAVCVFFMKNSLGLQLRRVLTGFVAGVMVAASIWSLLIHAMELGSVIPTVIGFWF